MAYIVEGSALYERFLVIIIFITPPRNRGGVIFSLQFVCVCVFLSVCLFVCVSSSSCEQNSSRTDAPIWMLVSLNGCLLHWLGKRFAKNSNLDILKIRSHHLIENVIIVILIPNMTILQNKLESVHRAQTPPQYMPYRNWTIFET